MFQPKQKTRRQRLYIFRLNCRSSLITGILKQRTRCLSAQTGQKKLPSSQEHLGGHGARIFSYQFLEPYITSDSSNVGQAAHFRYVDHVDNIKISNFPESQYIHAAIPLFALFELLPVSKARKVASMHGISTGSRSTQAQLLDTTVNHSCLACTAYSSIFVPDKNSTQLCFDRVVKCRKKQNLKLKSKNLNSQKNLVHDFPPEISDDHYHTIISNACQKMNKDNIEEGGCAVCGELKPLKNLSRIKNIKNMIHILSTPGVTRIERKNHNLPVREYSGPVLDYACNKVCDHCRSSIRNGKIPCLALANNLWLGKVPEELKNLRFVEKLLIAHVRHTCSYVKVASGMRKMKANIIAFESPIPKIYNVLPPPRDDMDDVLAILFTGPCKPTSEDLKRTPFLVRRNHVAKALEWLKLNHCDYADIEISSKNLDQYDENSSPVSIEYRESNANKVVEGTSVFDK